MNIVLWLLLYHKSIKASHEELAAGNYSGFYANPSHANLNPKALTNTRRPSSPKAVRTHLNPDRETPSPQSPKALKNAKPGTLNPKP